MLPVIDTVPCSGAVTTVNVSSSPSASVAVSGISTEVSSAVVALAVVETGTSLGL